VLLLLLMEGSDVLACCELTPALLSLLVSLLLLNAREEEELQLQPAPALLLLLPHAGGKKRSITALHSGSRPAWCCNSLAAARDLVTTAAGMLRCVVCGLCVVLDWRLQ
jgi:hypothetical protein